MTQVILANMQGVPLIAVTEETLETIAVDHGYDNAADYASDHGLARCDDCGRWGILGDVMTYKPGQDRYDGVICWSHLGASRTA